MDLLKLIHGFVTVVLSRQYLALCQTKTIWRHYQYKDDDDKHVKQVADDVSPVPPGEDIDSLLAWGHQRDKDEEVVMIINIIYGQFQNIFSFGKCWPKVETKSPLLPLITFWMAPLNWAHCNCCDFDLLIATCHKCKYKYGPGWLCSLQLLWLWSAHCHLPAECILALFQKDMHLAADGNNTSLDVIFIIISKSIIIFTESPNYSLQESIVEGRKCLCHNNDSENTSLLIWIIARDGYCLFGGRG